MYMYVSSWGEGAWLSSWPEVCDPGNLRTSSLVEADIEGGSVCTVCAGVCKHAELSTCFLSENMVGSGCQVQPRALPAVATVRLQGAVLDRAGRTDGASVKDRTRGVEAAAFWRTLVT